MIKRFAMVLFIIILIVVNLSGCKLHNKQIDKEQNYEEKNITSDFEEIKRASMPEKIPEILKQRVDTLVVGINAPNAKFNPLYSNSIYDNWVCSLVFNGLITNDASGNPVANIAESFHASEDGKTYIFKLRDNIRFSDGTTLTAEDVLFTYTALCDPEYSGIYVNSFKFLEGYKEYHEGNAAGVAGIKLLDNNHISFTFKEVRANAIYDFSVGILSKKYYNFRKGHIEKMNEKLVSPMGAGAFILTSFKAGKEIKFRRNEGYWEGSPKISNIIMKVSNDNLSIKNLLNGSVDIGRVAATPQNVAALEQAGFLNLHLYDDNGYQYIGLNLRKDKFSDKRVRQGLIYGLNRKLFIDEYYGEYGSIFNVPFSKPSWTYPKENGNSYAYDIDKANSLLEEAGWILKSDGWRYNAEGKKFTIRWLTYENNNYVAKLISRVKEDWKSIGVEVIEEIVPFTDLVRKVFEERDFDMYNMAWTLGLDPDPTLMFAFSEDVPGGYNAVGWRNEEGEKLINDGLKELNRDKRISIYNIWAEIANEELPYIYLNQNKELYAVSCRIKNLDLSPYVDWTMNAHKLYIEIE